MTHPRTLPELLFRLRDHGDAPAILVIGDQHVTTLSFGALFDASQRIANDIAARGLRRGSTIGLMASNGPAWVEAFWAIVAAGGVAMPIDVQSADADIRRMVAIGACRLVLVGREWADRLQSLVPACGMLDIEAPRSPQAASALPVALPDPEDTALLVFTSGTTGAPKAVPLSHANLLSNINALVEERIIGPHDRALMPLPLHHAYPLTVGMMAVLASGATMILPSGISGPQLVAAIRQGQATALLGVPRLYDALLANIRAEAARQFGQGARLLPLALAASSFIQRRFGVPAGHWAFRALHARIGPTLRLMVSGGAALSVEAETALLGLGWQVLTGYGLTETSPILSFNRPGRARIGSVGQALPGVRLRIANADQHGNGEIEVRGDSVFAGYRQDDDATRRAFTADGWFQTGDLGRLDADGYLFVNARANETIVLPTGKKIDPESVEKLYAPDPLIGEVAVLRWGAGLAALIVPRIDAMRQAGVLRGRGLIRDALNVRGRALAPYLRLAGFALTRQPLPRTQLGKLRRHLLPALYEKALDAQGAEHDAVLSVEDAALLAQPAAAAIWAWMRAHYPGQTMTLDTSPQLDMGIDSLGWLDVTLALQRDLGIALTEQQIARSVTIRDLLREAVAAASQAAIPGISAQNQTWLEPYGPGPRVMRVMGEALVRAAMGTVFRLRVRGRETLPTPPFLICPNHVSYLDAFALAAALPHRQLQSTYWAGWTGLLFSSRLQRAFSRAAQIIPMDPDRAAAAGLALGAAVLSKGQTLVWFPEGSLSPDGTLQPFQPGVGALLERCPVPVVPAYISGTDAALPPGRRLPRPARIGVRFGTPIGPASMAPGVAGRARSLAIAGLLHAAVAALKP